MRIFRAYCDGVKSERTGGSAVSFVITEDNSIKQEMTNSCCSSSSNEAEMKAVISVFEWIRNNGGSSGDKVLIYTNLKTISDAFDKGWMNRWMTRGWRNSDGKPVRHRELWEAINANREFFDSDIRHAAKDDVVFFSRLKKRVRRVSDSFDKVLQTKREHSNDGSDDKSDHPSYRLCS